MTEELLNALKLIKAECEKHYNLIHSNCHNCPMSDSNGNCGVLTDEPTYWALEKREVYF